MARTKKDKSITIDGRLTDSLVEWKSFVTETAGMKFGGVKLTPNEDETALYVEHAIGISEDGVRTEFTEQLRDLITGTKSNVTPLATGTNG